jgi:hypothetical protein
MNLENTEEVVEPSETDIVVEDEGIGNTSHNKKKIKKKRKKRKKNILEENKSESPVEKQTNGYHPIFNRFGSLSCLDIIKKVRTEGFSNTRKTMYDEEFTPRVEMDFNVILGEKLGDVKCDECGEIQPLDNYFFQEHLQGSVYQMCRKCWLGFLYNEYELEKLYKIYNLVDEYEFEILEYKKNVLIRGDRDEVYKSKIMIENEVFYGLILCYIFEECNELSSTPYDYFSYVTFIFKDINTLNENYDTLELVTNYMAK